MSTFSAIQMMQGYLQVVTDRECRHPRISQQGCELP